MSPASENLNDIVGAANAYTKMRKVFARSSVEREVEKLMVSGLGPRIYARLHDMGDKSED
jgi:hypothetical protein